MILFFSIWAIIALSTLLLILECFRFGIVKMASNEEAYYPNQFDGEEWLMMGFVSIFFILGWYFMLSEFDWEKLGKILSPKLTWLVKEHTVQEIVKTYKEKSNRGN